MTQQYNNIVYVFLVKKISNIYQFTKNKDGFLLSDSD